MEEALGAQAGHSLRISRYAAALARNIKPTHVNGELTYMPREPLRIRQVTQVTQVALLAGFKMPANEDMRGELKRVVIPSLRDLRFKGSMPHFHRIADDGHVDLLTIQFASGGGSFVVELGFADSERHNVYFKKETPAKKLKASQTTVRRRLGASDDTSDYWFAYEGTPHVGITGDPQTLATTVRTLLASEAVRWWDSKRQQPT